MPIKLVAGSLSPTRLLQGTDLRRFEVISDPFPRADARLPSRDRTDFRPGTHRAPTRSAPGPFLPNAVTIGHSVGCAATLLVYLPSRHEPSSRAWRRRPLGVRLWLADVAAGFSLPRKG